MALQKEDWLDVLDSFYRNMPALAMCAFLGLLLGAAAALAGRTVPSGPYVVTTTPATKTVLVTATATNPPHATYRQQERPTQGRTAWTVPTYSSYSTRPYTIRPTVTQATPQTSPPRVNTTRPPDQTSTPPEATTCTDCDTEEPEQTSQEPEPTQGTAPDETDQRQGAATD